MNSLYTLKPLGVFFKSYLTPNLLFILFLFTSGLIVAQPAYDLEVAKPVAITSYKIWQKDQLYAFGGMANVNNLGTEPFQNPKLKLDIFNSGSALLWSDSLWYNGIITPMPGKYFPSDKIGEYTGLYTVSQDVTDFDTSDNEVSFSYRIDKEIMSKEDIGNLGTGMSPVADPNYTWGNIYHITNNKSAEGKALFCNEVQVGIANGVELSQNNASIFVFLYKWNNVNGNDVVESDEKISVGFTQHDFEPGNIDNQVYTMPMFDFNTFDQGVLLESNSTYILAIQYSVPPGSPNLECKILADPDLDYGMTSLKDSLLQNADYGHHVLDVGNTGDLLLSTLNGNAVPVVRMLLSSSSYVAGKVYLDFDCDQVFNNLDKPIVNKVIIDYETKWPVAITDKYGDYTKSLTTFGSYSYSIYPAPGVIILPEYYNIVFNTKDEIFINKDFSVCVTGGSHDLGVELSPFNPPRPGFENYYNVCVKNLGSFIENAKMTFDFKNGVADSYTEILDAEGGIINGHTVTWENISLDYFQDICKVVTIKVKTTTPIGTIFTPHAKVTADNGVTELTLLNNETDFDQSVVGSFDPNDKTVSKVSFSESDLKNGVNLEYLIRFQNTGNYPATFIEVLDTIQSTLDLEHFEMLSASHEFTFTIINENILKWRFNNINLPDSTSNEPGSHGYIKFKIKTKENLTKQDVISNSAAIYFDFNLPVITNTAKTEFVTPTFNILKDKLELNAYPNPALNIVRLEYSLLEKSNCTIEIIDPSGKIIENRKYQDMNSGSQSEKIDMSSFSSGVYLIRVITGKEQGESKVVKL